MYNFKTPWKSRFLNTERNPNFASMEGEREMGKRYSSRVTSEKKAPPSNSRSDVGPSLRHTANTLLRWDVEG